MMVMMMYREGPIMGATLSTGYQTWEVKVRSSVIDCPSLDEIFRMKYIDIIQGVFLAPTGTLYVMVTYYTSAARQLIQISSIYANI